MAPRGVFNAMLVIACLSLVACAEATPGQVPPAGPPEHAPPEHAKAHGLAKRAEPEPALPADEPAAPPPEAAAPPADPSEPATEAPPPPAPPALAPAHHLPSHPPHEPQPQAASEETSPLFAASLGGSIVPRSPSVESRLDRIFGGALEEGGAVGSAATTRAPVRAGGGALAPQDAPGGGAPWWLHLLWAVPLAGAGGVAAVLLTRTRTRTVPVTQVGRPGRMAPVSPEDLKGLLQNGHVAASRGAYAEAVAWFEHALRVAPELGVAYFCKGVCLAANGRVADAYGALRAAVDVEPADASYRIHFARVALAVGKHNEAMDALALVARAMPELGPAMLEDPQLAALRDHPRFLMLCGAL